MGIKKGFLKCCAEEIQRIWNEHGGSMNIVRHETNCPKCGHYIGITQTSKEEADIFLKKFGLEQNSVNDVKAFVEEAKIYHVPRFTNT